MLGGKAALKKGRNYLIMDHCFSLSSSDQGSLWLIWPFSLSSNSWHTVSYRRDQYQLKTWQSTSVDLHPKQSKEKSEKEDNNLPIYNGGCSRSRGESGYGWKVGNVHFNFLQIAFLTSPHHPCPLQSPDNTELEKADLAESSNSLTSGPNTHLWRITMCMYTIHILTKLTNLSILFMPCRNRFSTNTQWYYPSLTNYNMNEWEQRCINVSGNFYHLKKFWIPFST